jgi:hypothetical protein
VASAPASRRAGRSAAAGSHGPPTPSRSTCSRTVSRVPRSRSTGLPAWTCSSLCPASSGSGDERAYRSRSGASGRASPSEPSQKTTTSARTRPAAVTTPVTRPPARSTVTTSSALNRAPRAFARRAWASAARRACSRPSPGTWKPPSSRVSSRSGCRSAHSRGVRRKPRTPHDVAQPWRRRRSASRSGVVARSRLPTGLKHHWPSRPPYFAAVYFANSVSVRSASVRNTSPGPSSASPPPRTVTSVQPRSVSSSASAQPSRPPPATTTRGRAAICSSGRRSCAFGNNVRHARRGVKRPKRCPLRRGRSP